MEAFEAASKHGGGVITLGGQIVQAQMVARARETLRLAGIYVEW